MPDASRKTFHPPITLLLGACALVASGVAIAAEPAPPPSVNGALQFPNVRVVNAPTPFTSSTLEGAAGLRAFVDPSTGQLRQATPEEMQEAAAKPSAARSSARAAAEPVAFATRSGGVRVMLDESQMQFAAVERMPDGRLVEVCVPGEAEALHAAHQRAAVLQGEMQ